MAHDANQIPFELTSLPQWVCWSLEKNDQGKFTKVPKQCNGANAKNNDSNTWTTFEQCRDASHKFSGIGFEFSLNDSLIGIDLDACRNPESGTLTSWAAEIVQRFPTYAEVSPSQTGLKLICKTTAGKLSKCRLEYDEFGPEVERFGEKRPAVEVFSHGVFFTITGDAIGSNPISFCDNELVWLKEKYFPQPNGLPEAFQDFQQSTPLLERAAKYIATMPPAIQGQGGSNAAFAVACVLMKGFLLETEEAYSLFSREYNPRCVPPWTEYQIRHKLADAFKQPGSSGYLRDALPSDWGKIRMPSNYRETPMEIDQAAKPSIICTLEENDVAEQVVTQLGKLENVYTRQGCLVSAVECDGKDVPVGSLRMMKLPAALVRERITEACQLVVERSDRKGNPILVATSPPKHIVEAVWLRGCYGGKIRPLSGIIQAPTIRQDGSILQTEGYDHATGLLYRPLVSFPSIPNEPTKDDAKRAANKLLDVIQDFPIASVADKAAWLSMALSMIGRPCVAGCVPLFALTGNIRGSGKSLLCDVASLIAYGKRAARRPFALEENELRKTITTAAIEATPSILFDNLACQLRGASLDAALTSTTWQDRLLGESKSTGELPLRTIWIATGNNLTFGSDIARRVIPIRLESDLENPEERSDFAHPDLLAHVTEYRAELATAALTILRAYFIEGCPKQSGDNFGSFESWTAIVRGSLVWAGVGDPLETRDTAKGNDESAELLRLLIYGLLEADPDKAGLTTKQIERLVGHKPDETPICPTLMEATSQICGDKFHAKRFTGKLRSFQGRTLEGMQIQSDNAGKGVKRWQVREVKGGLGCLGGLCFTPFPRDNTESDPCNAYGLGPESDKPNPPNQPEPPIFEVEL